MGTTADIVGRFPIDQLFLIVTAGLFIILSFPFDIYQPFTNGIPQPSLNSSITDLPTDLASGLSNLSNYTRGNFEPFAMIEYLAEEPFPTGLVKILLLSLPVGMIVFFLFTIYEKINHLLRQSLDSVARAFKKTYSVPARKPTGKARKRRNWSLMKKVGDDYVKIQSSQIGSQKKDIGDIMISNTQWS